MGSSSSVKHAPKTAKGNAKPIYSQRPTRIQEVEERFTYDLSGNKVRLTESDTNDPSRNNKLANEKSKRNTKEDNLYTPLTKDDTKHTQDRYGRDAPHNLKNDSLGDEQRVKKVRRFSQYDKIDENLKEERLYDEDNRDAMHERRYGKHRTNTGTNNLETEDSDEADELRILIEKRHRNQRFSLPPRRRNNPPGYRDPPIEAPHNRTRPERIVEKEQREPNFSFWGVDGVTF
ncbi:uncharacterized protein [Argopecten irradians]|uniref:uncharacterized protein n=1 Tax=Argopecten irradians TaxID=31199 RepID=UPI00372140F8